MSILPKVPLLCHRRTTCINLMDIVPLCFQQSTNNQFYLFIYLFIYFIPLKSHGDIWVSQFTHTKMLNHHLTQLFICAL
jgi:hypothetical protein